MYPIRPRLRRPVRLHRVRPVEPLPRVRVGHHLLRLGVHVMHEPRVLALVQDVHDEGEADADQGDARADCQDVGAVTVLGYAERNVNKLSNSCMQRIQHLQLALLSMHGSEIPTHIVQKERPDRHDGPDHAEDAADVVEQHGHLARVWRLQGESPRRSGVHRDPGGGLRGLGSLIGHLGEGDGGARLEEALELADDHCAEAQDLKASNYVNYCA